MLRVAFCNANGSDMAVLGRAVGQVRLRLEIDIRASENRDFREDRLLDEFIDFAKTADILIIGLHGGKDNSVGFDRLVGAMPASTRIFVHYTSLMDAKVSLEFSTVDKTEYDLLLRYLTYGGQQNYYNMLIHLINKKDGTNHPVLPPEPLPWEGIYHPDDSLVPTPGEYFRARYQPGRPTIGLWFHRETWVNFDTTCIDAFIREFEARQVNVIAVFRKTRQEPDLGNMGLSQLVDAFFKKDGKPVVDVIVNLTSFSTTVRNSKNNSQEKAVDQTLFELGAPVLKAIISFSSRASWEESFQGLSPVDVAVNAAMPELDGNIITLAGGFTNADTRDPLTGARIVRHEPDLERIARIADLAVNWARLKHIPNRDKKIAIVFHNYPPRNDTIGSAFGLDSKDSVWNILKELEGEGYYLGHLPENGDAIIGEILAQATNDLRWASPEQIDQKAVDHIPASVYRDWFGRLPGKVQGQMSQFWGAPPGELFFHKDRLSVPGVINGNIFLGIQPPRGNTDNPESVYHSPDLPFPHSYFAYYRWIREVFKADAVVHVGMHGSLEWLPGKALGLSDCCYPQIAISDLPNVYIYIVNNPGEGTQAKRRSNCCIVDHLIPVMGSAELYDETAELETQLDEYYRCKTMDPGKLTHLKQIIWDKVVEANLHTDLHLDEEQLQRFDDFVELLHGYLSELKDTQIKNGLHILGEPPVGERLVEFIVSITRLANGDIPSLRRALAELCGYDLDLLLGNRGKLHESGRTNGQLLEELRLKSLELVGCLARNEFQPDHLPECCTEVLGGFNEDICLVCQFICDTLVPAILGCKNELSSVVDALSGKFVRPGPTGNPTRGMAHILPTGRNFYSIDPQTVPSPATWKAGMLLAEDMLARYLKENGCYPENVGMVVFGSSTMRTNGEDEAEILYLLGVRPVWQKYNGYVKEVEVIPLEELGRPRLDVTVRISGLFRDAFPNVVEVLDKAVRAVAYLDEPPEANYVAKHVKEEIKELLSRGVDRAQALEEASYRIFGCKPGAYGAGVCNIVETKQWETIDDLAQIYLTWGGYAYSSKQYGKQAPELFKKRLSVMDAAVMNLDSREFEMIDSDDFYSFHGGMIAAVRSFKGQAPAGLIGDSSDPERIKTRTVGEEARFELRSRVFNPKWIESMKQHGYKGAGDIAQLVDHIFGWDVTAEVMDDKLYEQLAEKFVCDPELAHWLKENNPWALHSISERLLEAVQRGMWNASEEMQKELRKTYLEMEGAAEAI